MAEPAQQRGDYAFMARTPSGEREKGSLAGVTREEALARLHREGKVVLRLVDTSATSRPWTRFAPRLISALPARRVRVGDLALFTRQLATVLGAGIPVVRGLRGLAAEIQQPALSAAVWDVALRIEQGETISRAFAAHPEAFDSFYIGMLRAGEHSGTLDEILEALATHQEKADALRTKVQAALSYPVFVLVFTILAACFLLLKVVPTFGEMYAEMGQQLPALTRGVLGASDALRAHFLPVAFAVGALIVSLTALGRTRKGRRFLDGVLLRLPAFGIIVRKSVMSRVCRSLGILLRSGLPILTVLEMVRETCGNAAVAEAVESTRDRVGRGHGLAESFRASREFPEMVLQLIATGEEAGDLDAMVLKGAEFYDRQVDAAVQGITSLIEPVLIVLVGGMIGIVVIAMFLPIFSMGEAVMRGGFGH